MTTLKQVVERVGPLDFRRAARYVVEVAEQLVNIHATGRFHSAVQPSNIVLNELGRAELGPPYDDDDARCDVVVMVDEMQWALETADFLAPELALATRKADARADVYNLGGVFYFLLTGQAPFGGGSVPERLIRHQTESPPDVLNARPVAPPELAQLCQQMMAKSRDDRPKSAEAIAEILKTWLDRRRGL